MKRKTRAFFSLVSCGAVIAALGYLLIESIPRRVPSDPIPQSVERAPFREPALRLGGTQFRHHQYGFWFEGEALVFSPDSRTLYSGGSDGTVKAWNPETGDVRRSFSGHDGAVDTIAISKDGTRLASGDDKGVVRLWDAERATVLWMEKTHRERVGSVSFSPDGTRLISGGDEGDLCIRDVATGHELQRIQPDEEVGRDGAIHAAYAPDGLTFVTMGYRDPYRIWNATDGRELRRLRTSSWGPLCFSPTGHLLARGWSFDPTIFDPGTGMVIAEFAGFPNRSMRHACFSPDGKRIAFGGLFESAEVWDVATKQRMLELEGHRGKIISVTYSPNGKWIATAGTDGVVRLFEAETGKPGLRPDGHQTAVSAIVMTADDEYLFSSGSDGTIRQWAIPSGKWVRTLSWDRGSEGIYRSSHVHSLRLTSDGGRLISGDTFGPIRIWETKSGKQLNAIAGGTYGMALSRNDETLVRRGDSPLAGAWDVKTGKMLRPFPTFPWRRVEHAPDRDEFAAPDDESVGIRSSVNGELIRRLPLPKLDDSTPFAYSPDGTRLVAAQRDGAPYLIFHVESGRAILPFGAGTKRPSALTWSPDGRWIASADSGVIAIWDAETGARLDWFETGQWGVGQLTYDHAGKTLYSAGLDGTICGWR